MKLINKRYPDLTLEEVRMQLDRYGELFKEKLPPDNRYPAFIVRQLLTFMKEQVSPGVRMAFY